MGDHKEVWIPVPLKRWNKLYAVSDYGRVKLLRTERLRALYKEQNGYLRVILYKGNSRKKGFVKQRFSVHQLVALAFVGPKPTASHQVNHKDFDKTNNIPDNLEWVTHTENIRHRAKMSMEKVEEFRRRVASGELPTIIAKDYGISWGHACVIARGEAWT